MMTVKVDDLDHLHAAVAGDVLVGRQRRGPGDVGLHARRRVQAVDEALHGLDRLVGQGLAHGCRRGTPGRRRPCRRCSARRPRSAGRPRNPGRARRGWCRPRACRPSRRRSGGRRRRAAARPPARSSPSCRSRTPRTPSPTRFIAITDGASSGLIDTERIWPTTSSCGTTMLRTPMIAIQPRMMGIASRRIHFANPVGCVVSTGAVMRTSA